MTSSAARGYGGAHRALREQWAPRVAAGVVLCARCGRPIEPGEPWDLGHDDVDRSRYTGPEHQACNRATSVRGGGRRPELVQGADEPPPERDGLASDDPRWRVPWLAELRRVPEDAVWPRLMTVPHPRAVGSYGAELCAAARERSGRDLRWWQQLVAARLLEHDLGGRLVWETCVLSTARQVGKSWLLRELCMWRLHQGERFAEPQDVLHTGKDLAVCKEIQRAARIWAKQHKDLYRVREVNGQEEIELLVDGSRWMLRAKEAVYGYSAGLAAVDEAWKVSAAVVDEGLTPTMTEREQAQLLLVSTAHRKATALMMRRRATALEGLEEGDGDLLIEWSAPAGVQTDDRAGWRAASPHWSDQRERLIAKRHDAMSAGEIEDPDEPDPVQAFTAQWLNQWPRKLTITGGPAEPLLPAGVWEQLAEQQIEPLEPGGGPVWVALEDNYGRGAAVACARALPGGRLELDGWQRGDWDSAIADAERLHAAYRVRRVFVGASLMARVPASLRALAAPHGTTETRSGLALFRDLALGGMVAHDQGTDELDAALGAAMVRETSAGLGLVAGKTPTHLVRAAMWALAGAHRPPAVPAVH